MFKIDASPTFWRTVKVRVPSGEGFEDASFRARYRLLGNSEFEGLDLKDKEATKAFAHRLIIDLDDIEGDDGLQAAFSAGLLDKLLDRPDITGPLFAAYHIAVAGEAAGN